MKNYRESVAPFADYQQLIQMNPFDAVVCLIKVDKKVFEVVDFNDKLLSFMELQDKAATNAERFFTKQCWLQLSNFLNEEDHTQHVLKLGTGYYERAFAIHVQHFSKSMVAVILRETQLEEKPYLQYVEQHVSPVLTLDLQGRIIHQNMAVTSALSRQQQCLIGRDIFSLLESKYIKEFKLLFAKTIEGSAFGMTK